MFIRNKTAQVFSHMFLVDFVERWPSFMSDIMATLASGPNAADLYLKILLAIDAEVAFIFSSICSSFQKKMCIKFDKKIYDRWLIGTQFTVRKKLRETLCSKIP